MKNIEILDLASVLATYAKDLRSLKGAKFGFALLKNIDKLTTECKTIEAARNIPEGFKEYEKKRIELCEKYSEKDENGKPKKKQFSQSAFEYIIDQTNDNFLKEIEALNTEYAADIDAFSKTEADYKIFLESDNAEFKLSLVDFDAIPADISVELLSVIKPFIKDEE